MKIRLLWIIGSILGLLYSFLRFLAMGFAGTTLNVYYNILITFPILSTGIGLLSCFLYNRYQKLANILLCFSISNALFLSIESILHFVNLPNINIGDFDGLDMTNSEISDLRNSLFMFSMFFIILPMIYFISTSISLMSLIKNNHYKPYYLLIFILTLIPIGFKLSIDYFIDYF
ncbi:hypothetical protein IKE_06464 [Bacillus cereus VD196]|uniref:Uncharacterized protein n=1 Tax=Bacillus cereus VD196 TaxID=1053243 RepID=A0A9W5V5F8_BACCE|nr:hypothetical protein [Bacillus cereus]EOO56598.1 hypothetical protein IKE_06464 [Bacillus cereus VD196]